MKSNLFKSGVICLTVVVLALGAFMAPRSLAQEKSPFEEMAFELAALFRAYRATITKDKARIHEPDTYFTKDNIDQRVAAMHSEVKENYKKMTGNDYPTDDRSFKGTVRTNLEKSFEKVLRDYVKGDINLQWKGKNDFISTWDGKMLPARFAAYAAKNFKALTDGMITIKLTTSDKLLVNEDNAPDDWESETIASLLDTNRSDSPQFKAHAGDDEYRFLLPEFYGQGCIKCHGTQNDELGHKVHPTKIDRKLDDFAGAISIVIKN